ncbi:MAG TPA: DHHA1 domain-containing protein, partial [Thermoanaerobaculales bacterium]|nr:DHHA1 domain-containing protein [Thermoanaerobaculales bacterium]
PPRRVRARFQRGAVDVRRIAERFGGGGHANAAGCTLDGDLPSAREAVLAAVRETLEAAL